MTPSHLLDVFLCLWVSDVHFGVCVHMSVCLCTYIFAQETREGYWPGVAVNKLEFKSGGQGLGHLSPCSGPCPTFYINPLTHLLLIWFRDYVHPHLHVSPLWALVKLCSFTPEKYSCSSFIKVQRPRNPECGEDLPIYCPLVSFLPMHFKL